jgi:enoyl-CoA hydratase/carnithine racemase
VGALDAASWPSATTARAAAGPKSIDGGKASAQAPTWASGRTRVPLEADDLGRLWEQNAHAVMQELYGLPKPTVALLNGVAVGAGLDVACCFPAPGVVGVARR